MSSPNARLKSGYRVERPRCKRCNMLGDNMENGYHMVCGPCRGCGEFDEIQYPSGYHKKCEPCKRCRYYSPNQVLNEEGIHVDCNNCKGCGNWYYGQILTESGFHLQCQSMDTNGARYCKK